METGLSRVQCHVVNCQCCFMFGAAFGLWPLWALGPGAVGPGRVCSVIDDSLIVLVVISFVYLTTSTLEPLWPVACAHLCSLLMTESVLSHEEYRF